MPGLRGTPAGMMTTSQPESASASCAAPENARTCETNAARQAYVRARRVA